MIYLASPYSSSAKKVETVRYEAAFHFCSQHMISHPTPIFSPIVYGHRFAVESGIAGDADTWKYFNNHMLRTADSIWVLQLQGWDKSLGVTYEIERARSLLIPITYVEMPNG